jgi:hypothetical protein
LGVFTLSLAVFALIAAGASAHRAPAAHAKATANSTTYQDSTGEDPNSLDISTVTVSNDDSGLVTWDIKFANRSPDPSKDTVFVVLNTDQNESTGNPDTDGADWALVWEGETALLQWNGSDFVLAPSMTSVVSMAGPNELILKANTSEFGKPTSFNFYVKTYLPNPGDPNGEYSDWAPAFGQWTYTVKLYVPPLLAATSIKCTPDPPRAGKQMVGRMTVSVTRGGVPETLGSTATVKATATVGGRKLTGTVISRSNGHVAVRWVVPKSAKGKLLHATITVTQEKVSVTKQMTERVR